jgi:hypothetical protein
MEAILFVLFAAVVAVVGIGLGLAVAPRLSRWDERRSRTPSDEAAEAEGEVDHE